MWTIFFSHGGDFLVIPKKAKISTNKATHEPDVYIKHKIKSIL